MEAVPEPARRERGERRDDERGDTAADEQGLKRAAAACDGPEVRSRERNEHDRIELRAHGEPEQAEGEEVFPAQERGQSADGQCGREQVVRVEGDRPDRERREGKEPCRRVEPPPPHAEGHEHQRQGEERGEAAEGHQALEREVVGAAGKHGGREKDGESAGRVLDEEVAVRELAAQELVGVDAVEMHVPVALASEEASVGNRAGREKEGRRKAATRAASPARRSLLGV